MVSAGAIHDSRYERKYKAGLEHAVAQWILGWHAPGPWILDLKLTVKAYARAM